MKASNHNPNPDVINNMIHDSFKDILKDNEIDKDKLDILIGLVFEHIFHRTYNFVSDELNEFRDHGPSIEVHKKILDKHNKFINWSAPIVFESQKIIKKIKQIGVILSVSFTILFGIYETYDFVSKKFGYTLEIKKNTEINSTKK